MADEWFAEVEGKTVGPVGIDRIQEWSRAGRVTRETRVKGPDGLWTPAGEVPGLLSPSAGCAAAGMSDGSVPVISLQDTAQWDMLGQEVGVGAAAAEAAEPLPRRAPAWTLSPGVVLAALGVLVAAVVALLYWMR